MGYDDIKGHYCNRCGEYYRDLIVEGKASCTDRTHVCYPREVTPDYMKLRERIFKLEKQVTALVSMVKELERKAVQ